MQMTFGRFVPVCAIVACFVALGCSPFAVGGQYRVMDDQNVVLFEKFTATWCSACGVVAPTIDQLWANYGSTKLAIVEYHLGSSQGDPYAISDGVTRFGYYGGYYLPDIEIDGKGFVGSSYAYSDYSNAINARLSTSRNFTISISGDISSGSMDVHIDQKGSLSVSSLKVRYAVLESNLIYPQGSNPGGLYNHVVRAIPSEDSLSLPLLGSGANFTKTFAVNGTWDTSKLSFVAFLQDDTTKAVYQSCFYGYGELAVYEFNTAFVSPAAGIIAIISVAAVRRTKLSSSQRSATPVTTLQNS